MGFPYIYLCGFFEKVYLRIRPWIKATLPDFDKEEAFLYRIPEAYNTCKQHSEVQFIKICEKNTNADDSLRSSGHFLIFKHFILQPCLC